MPAVDPAASMSSRAAENLFWLGRYAERAEDVVRLLRVVHDRRNDFAHGTNPAGTACLRALLVALTHVTTTYPGLRRRRAPTLLADARRRSCASLVVDADRAGHAGLRGAPAARRRLRRPRPAVDRHLAGDRRPRPRPRVLARPRRPPRGRQATLGRVLASLLALAGLAAESMVRDPGWRFMDAGRRIERGLPARRAARRRRSTTSATTATDSLLLESVLTAAESIITYRRRYRSQAQLETVLDLLLLDAGQPPVAAPTSSTAGRGRRRAARGAGQPGRSDERVGLRRSRSPTRLRLADTAALARAGRDDRQRAGADRASSTGSSTASPAPPTPIDRGPLRPPAAAAGDARGIGRWRPMTRALPGDRTRRSTATSRTVSASYGELHLLPRDGARPACRLDLGRASTRRPTTSATASTSSATGPASSPSSPRTGRWW